MTATHTQQSPLIYTDWWSVITVTVGITVFAIAQGLTYPLISLLLAERGATETVVGLNAATFMAGIATSVLVIPSLTRHLRAGQVIVAGLAGAAIILAGFAVADNLAIWFLLRFTLGFCVNAIYVFGEAWLNAASADRVRGRVAGIYSAGMTLGFVIGPLAIPIFGTDDGLTFAACAVLISLAAFGLAILSRRAKVQPDKLALSDLPRFIQAAPLVGWELPECFTVLRRLLEARMGKGGKREFVQVLRLLERFRVSDVEAGIKNALERGTISFDAVKHLMLCRIERRPPRLDMTVYPYLPKAHVTATRPGDYMALLSGAGQ